MPSYFKLFPQVKYGDVVLTDVTRRAKFLESLGSNPLTFLPYTVDEGDRPEDVAFYYYGDPGYVWLIYLANNIVDPYTDWVMSDEDFNNYIIKKYETQSGSTGLGVIAWTQNTTITENILHYENIADPSITISKDTVLLSDSSIEASDWNAVRIYDHEFRLNQEKRNISVVNKEYAEDMEKELETLLNG